MSAAELTALLLFCTAMSFSPGPNTTLSTALAANLGLARALRFCLAVPTGWTLLMLASGLGLGALITGMPALRWAVTLLGVAYMLWLAWKIGTSASVNDKDLGKPMTFLQGAAFQWVNPKAWAMALTAVVGLLAILSTAQLAAWGAWTFAGVGLMEPAVLAVFAMGVTVGVLGMVPRWWRHRNIALKAQAQQAAVAPSPTQAATPAAAASASTPNDYPPVHGI